MLAFEFLFFAVARTQKSSSMHNNHFVVLELEQCGWALQDFPRSELHELRATYELRSTREEPFEYF